MFNWKLLEIVSSNNVLDYVKYYVSCVQGDNKVETEGYCYLKLAENVSFESLTEPELTEYVKRFYIQENVNTIESNLAKQMENLTKNTTNLPPWHIETFKVEV
jgi:hypothetical protein